MQMDEFSLLNKFKPRFYLFQYDSMPNEVVVKKVKQSGRRKGTSSGITSCWTFVRKYSSSGGQLICVHNGTRIISRQLIRCSWVKTICEQIYKWTLTKNCLFILNIWWLEVKKKIVWDVTKLYTKSHSRIDSST